MKRAIVLSVACLLFSACHRSGTWKDDPKNFSRAWGEREPKDVLVLHSWYWRSAHFTREEAYYFKFAPSEKLKNGFITSNSLQSIELGKSFDRTMCFEAPDWFAPKDASAYEAWSCRGNTECLLLRDRDSGVLYFSGCQL